MPNYQHAKIYKIVSENNEVYIGSTTQTLAQRKAQHKKHKTASCKHFDFTQSKIVLVEEYPCENKEQMFRREYEITQEVECINQRLPITNPERLEELRLKNQAIAKIKYHELPQIDCDICGKTIKNKYKLQEHNKKVHT